MRQLGVLLCLQFLGAAGAHSGGEFRVLFVGDSYTGVDEFPFVVESALRLEYRKAESFSVLQRGKGLPDLSKRAVEAIGSVQPNAVVLQDFSETPGDLGIRKRNASVLALREEYGPALAKLVAKGVSTRVLLYDTWTCPRNAHRYPSVSAMSTLSREGQEEYRRTLLPFVREVEIVPANDFFAEARKAWPSDEFGSLFAADHEHPSVFGVYGLSTIFAHAILRSSKVKLACPTWPAYCHDAFDLAVSVRARYNMSSSTSPAAASEEKQVAKAVPQ